MSRAELRRYVRHARRANLKFREPGGQWRTAFSTDISVGGLYISSNRIPEGDNIEIEITLGAQVLNLRGRIVRGVRVGGRLQRLQKGGFGVELEQPTPEQWYAHLLQMSKRR